MNNVKIDNLEIGQGQPLALIAGPCVLESLEDARRIATQLVEITSERKMPLIFKASYEKDNRGSEKSYIGPGLEKGLEILATIKREFGVPVVSDIHRETDIKAAAEVLDIIQIPAFLCQQTSLLLAAGRSGRVINVKKGQFLAPENMSSAVEKLRSTGNNRILLTERGSTFGYNRLVSDLTCIPVMQGLGCPVVYDPTHIIRIYGRPSKDPLGGTPQFVPTLTKAGVAAGANALFIETHFDPFTAACDAASMLDLKQLPGLLDQSLAIYNALAKFS